MRARKLAEREFILKNEQKVNKIVSWLMIPGLFVGLALIILRVTKVFPNAPLVFLGLNALIQTSFWLIAQILIKANPRNRAIKYFCLLSIEFATFLLSVSPGLVMFISFLIIPTLSCLYFNKRFSLTITTIGYLAMIASILIRGSFAPEESVVPIYKWKAAFCIGCSIEYILCAIIIVVVTGRMRSSLEAQFLQTEKIQKIQDRLILSIADLVESKDAFTGQHVQRTARYVERICAKMIELGYYPDELNEHTAKVMAKAAPLHDMGKIKVPESILEKPGKLTDEEFEVIKMHPLWGEKIIEKTFAGIEDDEFTQCALLMALTHHEWWNGRGYPLRLTEKEIPLCGRIMAAADVLDALLTVRPYKRAFTIDETMNIFADNSGIQFDPLVAEAVLEIETEIAYLQIEAINDSTIAEAKEKQSDLLQ